jgi:antitoxin (DNA-binding transcriptional repressor) of toxin-antitoxin stability system
MGYITVKDLKQTRTLWKQLDAEREMIITRDGKPCAILVGVNADSCEDTLAEIRRGLFSSAVSRIRRKAGDRTLSTEEAERLVAESRRKRSLA